MLLSIWAQGTLRHPYLKETLMTTTSIPKYSILWIIRGGRTLFNGINITTLLLRRLFINVLIHGSFFRTYHPSLHRVLHAHFLYKSEFTFRNPFERIRNTCDFLFWWSLVLFSCIRNSCSIYSVGPALYLYFTLKK